MLSLKWTKSEADTWLKFETFDMSTCLTSSGVYMIWHQGNPGRVVRLGQGNIRARLGVHRNDNEITQYRARGVLLVTWAAVPAAQLDGVERHLADRWNPLVGDAFPDCQPIAVNSPWS